jgi:uncharacterized protein (TIGR03118 family)
VPAQPGTPTGVVYSGSAQFTGTPAFLFATEDGTVAAWTQGSSAVLRVTKAGANYKGLAISSNANTSLLYAANFNAAQIDTFNANFASTTLAGSFSDTSIPSDFAPFNIENINDQLYVAYAKRDPATGDDVAGAGNGYINVFNTDGTFVRRLISAGQLNSPWGMAIAPASFGQFAGDLLVGNFGDGAINAFDPKTGQFIGRLMGKNGPIEIDGLWGLKFGNGANAGDPKTLFFTAGIAGPDALEDHGLFGSLSIVPEMDSALLLAVGLGLVAALSMRKRGAP